MHNEELLRSGAITIGFSRLTSQPLARDSKSKMLFDRGDAHVNYSVECSSAIMERDRNEISSSERHF